MFLKECFLLSSTAELMSMQSFVMLPYVLSMALTLGAELFFPDMDGFRSGTPLKPCLTQERANPRTLHSGVDWRRMTSTTRPPGARDNGNRSLAWTWMQELEGLPGPRLRPRHWQRKPRGQRCWGRQGPQARAALGSPRRPSSGSPSALAHVTGTLSACTRHWEKVPDGQRVSQRV